MEAMAEEVEAAQTSPVTIDLPVAAVEVLQAAHAVSIPTVSPGDPTFLHDDSAETSGEDDDDGDESGGKSLNSRLNVCKKSWTAAEDEILAEIVANHGAQRWSSVASHLPGRMGKQCRERYVSQKPNRSASDARIAPLVET